MDASSSTPTQPRETPAGILVATETGQLVPLDSFASEIDADLLPGLDALSDACTALVRVASVAGTDDSNLFTEELSRELSVLQATHLRSRLTKLVKAGLSDIATRHFDATGGLQILKWGYCSAEDAEFKSAALAAASRRKFQQDSNDFDQLDGHIREELALIEAEEMTAGDIQYHREKGKDAFFRSDGDRPSSGEEDDLLTTAAYQALRNAQAGGAMDTEESAIAIALTVDPKRDDSTQGARPTLYWRLEQGPNGNSLRYHLEENAAARDDPVVQLLLGTAEGLSTGQLSSTPNGHEAARVLVSALDDVHSAISKADPDGYGKGLHPCERFSLRHAGDPSLLEQFEARVEAQKSNVKGKGKA